VTKESARFSRFLYFLSGARIQEDISVRLSQYMTTLEVLFGTDPSELVHKLSERVAFFLGEDAPSRRRIFDIVRNAYKIRSKIVHGDAVAAKDIEKARDISSEVDQLVRKVGLKILADPELKERFNRNKENLEEYFTELVMGR
jgi:Apea-like HEPN